MQLYCPSWSSRPEVCTSSSFRARHGPLGIHSVHLRLLLYELQVDWKLTRGKWRPKLLDYAKAHSEDTVREATASAFRSMKDAPEGSEGLEEAMSALTALKVS